MLWLGGAVKAPCKVEQLVSQTDLAATLLAQMGLPHAEYTFSRSVFSSAYRRPFIFYTFNNGFALLDSTDGTDDGNLSQPSLNEVGCLL